MTDMINRRGQTKARESLFWIALGVSCLWFMVAGAAGLFAWVTVLRDGYINSPWAVILLIPSTALPIIVGWGVLRAIRWSNKITGTRSVSRALAPLWTLVALAIIFGGFAFYKNRTMKRIEQQQRTGSITFNCVDNTSIGERVGSGSIKLRLTEMRRQRGFGNWTISWPGKPLINAESFEAHTGSIGGSQGLRWRETGGKETIALVSFSDMISDFGPSDLNVALVSGPLTLVQAKFDAGAATYYACNPDPKSWRE